MAFLSHLLVYGRDMKDRIDDGLRHSQRPKRLWFYRVTIFLQDIRLHGGHSRPAALVSSSAVA
jgi:hypothetical protein